MSRCEVWFLLLLPFFSAPMPNAEGPASCVEQAGVNEDVCGGEAELWSEGEKPGALLLWLWSSAFLLTPERWAPAPAPAPVPVMAQSFVWSTATTTEEEGELEDKEAEVACRTSMSSWAENFSSRLWMQAWLTAVSDCEKESNSQTKLILKTVFSQLFIKTLHFLSQSFQNSHCWVHLWWKESQLGEKDSGQRDIPAASSPAQGPVAFPSPPEVGREQTEQGCHSWPWYPLCCFHHLNTQQENRGLRLVVHHLGYII